MGSEQSDQTGRGRAHGQDQQGDGGPRDQVLTWQRPEIRLDDQENGETGRCGHHGQSDDLSPGGGETEGQRDHRRQDDATDRERQQG